jgi:hypothetical protein
MFWRGMVVVLASISIACGPTATLAEPTPTELLAKASANLANAKTAHIDGTGTFAISTALNLSFDFKLTGDAEMPDKSRLTTEMSLLGQSVSIDTITVGGRTFTRGLLGGDWTESAADDPLGAIQGGVLDPLGQIDLTAVTSVTEIDRPEIDGRKTRHLSYVVDQSKLLQNLKSSPVGTTPALSASGLAGKGEIWIRTDDNQIVRQLVKVSVEADGGLGIPGASPTAAFGKLEISFDIKFSHLGEPLSPAITAPPAK